MYLSPKSLNKKKKKKKSLYGATPNKNREKGNIKCVVKFKDEESQSSGQKRDKKCHFRKVFKLLYTEIQKDL